MEERPVFSPKPAVKNEYGLDLTQKNSFHDYFMKCMDNDTDIDIQHYTVTVNN